MNHVISIRQRGSALIIAIFLLLLLTLAVFVAVPSMLGEQRISGNDVRAKLAHHVAEAGLSHVREFLRLNASTLIPNEGAPTNTALWTACGVAETSFPCGTIEPDVANAPARGNHYRYIGGADGRTVTFSPGRMYDGTGNDAGNFNASYDAGILMCRLTAANACTRTSTNAVGASIFTIVSRGVVTGEGTSATVSDSIGTFRLINLPPSVPPLMAAGTITGLGSSTIVGNPNSGGEGIPLSIWARNNFDGSGGSWQTCQLDEYLRSNLGGVVMEGAFKDVTVCDDCECPAGKRQSEAGSVEGFDILDSTDADGGKVLAGASYQFPCDMFEYIFGVKARTDGNTNGVCETPKTDGGDPILNDADEWLAANATVMTCSALASAGENASGVIWIKGPCVGGDALSSRIGSPDKPVLLIIDGSLKLNTSVKFFGLIFLRYTAATGFEDCVSTGTGCPEIEPGGGGAQVYGSIVVEGGGKINGTLDLVYLPQIFSNFNRSPENHRFAGLPGAWSDRVAY